MVVVFRNLYDTALSYNKLLSDTMDLRSALAIAHTYNDRILALLKDNTHLPTHFISFQKLTENPDAEAQRLADFVGKDYTEEKREQVRTFVIPREKIASVKRRAQLKRHLFRHVPRSLWRKLRGA